jgi:carboxyl-terminal processing protease
MAAEQNTKKQKEPARILLGLAIALILTAIAATFFITMSISERMYGDLISSLSPRAAMYDTIQELDTIVRNNYYGEIDTLNHTTQLEIGYIKGIGDGKSSYLSAADYKAYLQRMKGSEQGAGMTTAYEGGKLLVTRVFPSSPAEKTGLKLGDEITEVAGTAVSAQNAAALRAKFTGGTLSSVQVKYKRGDKTNSVKLMLGFSSPSVVCQMQGQVGYIKIFAFYEKTASELSKAIDELKKNNPQGYVFDLRGTAEGSVEYAAKALDIICPVVSDGTGALATLVGKGEKVLQSFPSDALQFSSGMAVLVNAKTSGPAELFACDLRDLREAVLVGEKTAGVSTEQKVFELKDGGGILLTIAKVLPAITSSYEGGLEPKIAVSLTDENKAKGSLLKLEEDAQALAAFAIFEDAGE